MTDTTPRARLLQAARDVVAEDGLEGLTLRAIARRAGVSHGAPLRHFPSLAALLSAVATDGFDRLVRHVDEALDALHATAADDGAPVDARRRVAAAGHAYVEFALDDPGVFSVTFRPERVDVTDPDYLAASSASFAQLVSLVEEAQAEGWRPGTPSGELAAVLWAHVHGVAVLSLHGEWASTADRDAAHRMVTLSTQLVLGDDVAPPTEPTTEPTTTTPTPTTGEDHP